MDSHEQTLPLQEVRNYLDKLVDPFTEEEIKSGFEKLTEDNKIMISDDEVYLI